MKSVGLALSAILLLSLPGCKSTQEIPTEDLAEVILSGSRLAAQNGIKLALAEKPEKAEEIKKGVELAVKVIREDVLPVFTGSTTAEVLRGAVDTALELLSSKLTPELVEAIQFAVDYAVIQFKLPENPADKLSDRTRTLIVAFFNGTQEGLAAGISGPPKPEADKVNWDQ